MGRTMHVLLSIRLAVEKFEFSLLMKVDIDSYVFGDRLILALNRSESLQRGHHEALYLGNFQEGKGRRVSSKDPAMEDELGKDHSFSSLTGLDNYPLHARGTAYILSWPLSRFLAMTNVPFKAFAREDIAIGAWLMAVD